MVEFFITTLRLLRSVGSAWRRDREFRSLMFLVAVTLLGGTVFYSCVEEWSVVDALYFSVATLTTVGLGDLSPETTVGKVFTVIYIFAGLSIILGFIEAVSKETLGRTRGRTVTPCLPFDLPSIHLLGARVNRASGVGVLEYVVKPPT